MVQKVFIFELIPVRVIVSIMFLNSLVGCSSSPVNNSVLKNMLNGELCGSLENYRIVTIMPFDVQADVETSDQCGKIFAHYIYLNLSYYYSHLFDRIIADKPLGADNELIISGQISKYQLGSKFAQHETLCLLGEAQFDANLVLINGKTQNIICQVPVRELLNWWDYFESIDDLMRKDAEGIAQTIARLKNQEQ